MLQRKKKESLTTMKLNFRYAMHAKIRQFRGANSHFSISQFPNALGEKLCSQVLRLENYFGAHTCMMHSVSFPQMFLCVLYGYYGYAYRLLSSNRIFVLRRLFQSTQILL